MVDTCDRALPVMVKSELADIICTAVRQPTLKHAWSRERVADRGTCLTTALIGDARVVVRII